MPELPEVQTIITDLKKVLPGLVILDVWSDWKKMIKKPESFEKFKKEISGKKILEINRRGKNILINLAEGKILLIHQKMTGHLLYGKFQITNSKLQKWTAIESGPIKDDPQNRFIHLVFSLSNGKHLALSDVRKFAKVLIWDADKLDVLEDIKNIGPDPMDESFTFDRFKEILPINNGTVREVLMNQKIIAGIGNIYVSEILWNAGIYPFKEARKIRPDELKKLYDSVKKILKQAVKLRGDSIVDYRDAFGEKGGYQNFHKAYRREGEKCLKNDGGIIKRIKKGGRSAFYCPVHQK